MFFRSLKYAISGILQTFRGGRNFRIMCAAFILVITAACIFQVSWIEWAILLICSSGVFALEIFNSAIEKLVDLVTTKKHPHAKSAKDMAAGAVLVWSIFSAAVGLIIFLPHFFTFLDQ